MILSNFTWHNITEASIQLASKTSSMPAISKDQGALVTAVKKNGGGKRDSLMLHLAQEAQLHVWSPPRKKTQRIK